MGVPDDVDLHWRNEIDFGETHVTRIVVNGADDPFALLVVLQVMHFNGMKYTPYRPRLSQNLQ